MAFVLADRVRETSLTNGTGALTLAGAQTGFQAFSSKLATNDITFYAIVLGTQWETGIGTLTSATTLTRSQVIESSNANALVNFGTGTKDVFIAQPGSYLQPATDAEVIAGSNGYRPVTPLALGNEFTRRRASLSEVNGGTVTNRFITPKELADTTLPLIHADVQDFLGTSGTWTKPPGVSFCLIEVIDGGSGGSWNSQSTGSTIGGNGGEYTWRIMRATDLPATVTANVGAGGAAGTSGSTAGGAGGASYFGTSLATAYLSTQNAGPSYRGLGALSQPGGNASKGGAAGGGSGSSGGQAGGVSTEAGNGGAGLRSTTSGAAAGAGQVPGGGGGGGSGNGGIVAGAGAAGRVKISSF